MDLASRQAQLHFLGHLAILGQVAVRHAESVARGARA
jgi:hypothetical protein